MSRAAVWSDVRIERRGPVSLILVCRPAARNAFRRRTLDDARAAVEEELRQGARALVLTGEGDQSFSAGADLKEMRASNEDAKAAMLEIGWRSLLDAIESASVPVIAAIRGYAVGGGLELALACHIRIVAHNAKLGLPEILRGHIPGAGGTVRLPRMVGTGRALQYLLTGDFIDADEAYRIGLANSVVPDSEVVDRAIELANRIAGLPRLAVELTLRSVMTQRGLSLDDALRLERELCREMRKADDYVEGLDAFVQKRDPKYAD